MDAKLHKAMRLCDDNDSSYLKELGALAEMIEDYFQTKNLDHKHYI